jgi:hypothetical protein
MKAITADSVVRELTELLDRLASGSPCVPPFEPLARAEINGAGTP